MVSFRDTKNKHPEFFGHHHTGTPFIFLKPVSTCATESTAAFGTVSAIRSVNRNSHRVSDKGPAAVWGCDPIHPVVSSSRYRDSHASFPAQSVYIRRSKIIHLICDELGGRTTGRWRLRVNQAITIPDHIRTQTSRRRREASGNDILSLYKVLSLDALLESSGSELDLLSFRRREID